MVQMACYLAQRFLQEYPVQNYTISEIAATVMLIARESLHRHPWSPTLLKYTQYDECDLVDCLQDIHDYMTNPEVAVIRMGQLKLFN